MMFVGVYVCGHTHAPRDGGLLVALGEEEVVVKGRDLLQQLLLLDPVRGGGRAQGLISVRFPDPYIHKRSASRF